MATISDVQESLKPTESVTEEKEIVSAEATPAATSTKPADTVKTGVMSKTTADKVVPKLPDPVLVGTEEKTDVSKLKLGTIDTTARVEFSNTETVAVVKPDNQAAASSLAVRNATDVEKAKALMVIFMDNSSAMLGTKATPDTIAKSIKALYGLAALIMGNPSYVVMKEIYDFFKTNATEDILDPYYVLQGAVTNLNKEQRILTSTMVEMYRQVTKTPPKKINTELLQKIFQQNGDAVLRFLVQMGAA